MAKHSAGRSSCGQWPVSGRGKRRKAGWYWEKRMPGCMPGGEGEGEGRGKRGKVTDCALSGRGGGGGRVGQGK
jgi:hypothetical protein